MPAKVLPPATTIEPSEGSLEAAPSNAEQFREWVLDRARMIGQAFYDRPTDCPTYIEVEACINRIATRRRTADTDVMAVIMEMLRGQSTERPESLPDPVCIPIETLVALVVYRIMTDRTAIAESFVQDTLASAYACRRSLETAPTNVVQADPDDEALTA